MLRHLLTSLVLLVSAFVSVSTAHAESPGNAGFERGVNLSHWYAQAFNRSDMPEHLRTHVTAEDMVLIRSLGMDHVRLPVEPRVLRQEGFDGWAAYRKAVALILEHGLNVIIDVHATSEFKESLEDDPAAREAFVTFWEKLAEQMADTDPARVRLELLNEPMMPAEVWGPLQKKLATAVRTAAPEHTIVLGGAKWSGVAQLIELEPVDDPNVVYNFHFYEPHQFTHQAATWGAEHWREMKGLPYPASEQGVQAALAATENQRAIGDITRYGKSGWGAEKVRAEIGRAAQWAESNGGLTLTCNEFGVYMKAADPVHRAAWINDVRRAFEIHGIGWTMWDYAGGFGLVRDGEPMGDVIDALGLSVTHR